MIPQRELVTFLLVAYNQEKFIREAVGSALAQSYEPLEIIISDDCSPDKTYEIIEEMAGAYSGRHRVILNRNPENLGLVGNVNRALGLSSGSIVVMAGGDDVSLRDRVQLSWEVLSRDIEIKCVSLGLDTIDADGVPTTVGNSSGEDTTSVYNLTDFLNGEFQHPGASRAFRRSVFSYFGPLGDDAQTEDSTTLLRCLLTGSVATRSVVGVRYRVHGGNYSMFTQGLAIDRAKIHRQYMRDSEVALIRSKIDRVKFDELERVLSQKLDRWTVLNEWERADRKTGHTIMKIVPRPDVGIRQKALLLLRSVKADIVRVSKRPGS